VNAWETVLAVFCGVSLSAACGFRVFVPLLVISVASHAGHVQLAREFTWIASTPAVIAFSVATALEVLCYYIPWLDSALDAAATPLAVIAGTVLTAACITEMSPFLRWTLAVVAGGGAALTVQLTTAAVRGGSTILTGGLGNNVVATAEAGVSTILSVLAVVVTVVAFVLFLGIAGCCAYVLVRWIARRRSRRAQPVVT